jgi:23S rRNA (guanine745-N1)-methyltransferase
MSRGGWFACPSCGRDLEAVGGALRCSSGHSYEVSRRGYAALVAGRSGLVRSDPAAVLDAIDARWDGGAFAGVADAVVAMLPAGERVKVLDVGGDLGHVVAGARLGRRDIDPIIVSASPSALGRGMGRAGAAGALVDPVRGLPLRDGVAGVVLCTFAEHRPAEFHRVLGPGGVVIVTVEASRTSAVDDDLYPWFEHDQTRTIGSAAVLRYRRRRRPVTW